MSSFYENCDPEIKKKAENLINKIKTHEKVKRTLPNTSSPFSEEEAFENFDAITKSPDYDELIKLAYDD